MTKGEFISDFDRLCRGFRLDSTPEQIDAWFRKLAVYERQDWTTAVDTLLCGPRFPLLDPALAALDHARDHRKRTSQPHSERTDERLVDMVLTGRGCPLSPDLVACIKAFAGRQQVRTEIGLVAANYGERYDPAEQQDRLKLLRQREAVLTAEYESSMLKLSATEAAEFNQRYGAAVAA